MQALILISEVKVTIEFFTVKYLIGDSVCESRMVELNGPACTGDVCDVTSVISDSNCTIETDSDIIVTVSAKSGLGTGQESLSKFSKHLYPGHALSKRKCAMKSNSVCALSRLLT